MKECYNCHHQNWDGADQCVQCQSVFEGQNSTQFGYWRPRKALLIWSIIGAVCIGLLSYGPETPIGSFSKGFVIGLFSIAIYLWVYPFWIKAVWNDIVIRLGNFRAIGYWEALGIVTLVAIFKIL